MGMVIIDMVAYLWKSINEEVNKLGIKMGDYESFHRPHGSTKFMIIYLRCFKAAPIYYFWKQGNYLYFAFK